jgi:hypothetical protein
MNDKNTLQDMYAYQEELIRRIKETEAMLEQKEKDKLNER